MLSKVTERFLYTRIFIMLIFSNITRIEAGSQRNSLCHLFML